MSTRHITWLTATTIWMINPVFTGCEGPAPQDEFDFGEAEMLDVLDDMNEETWNIDMDGLTYEVTVDFQQRISQETAANISFIDISSAHACGSRSFFAEADACLDVTSLPIKGTVSILPLDSEGDPLHNFPETFVVGLLTSDFVCSTCLTVLLSSKTFLFVV